MRFHLKDEDEMRIKIQQYSHGLQQNTLNKLCIYRFVDLDAFKLLHFRVYNTKKSSTRINNNDMEWDRERVW